MIISKIFLEPLEQEDDEKAIEKIPKQPDTEEIATEDEDAMASSVPTATSWWLAIEERRKSRAIPSRRKWIALLLGQAIALVASSMNAASFTLSYHNKVDTQLFQLFIMYLLLSVHLLLRERKVSTEGLYCLPFTTIRLQMPWWIYLTMSTLDIIPNFLQLVSFHYTSLTSTTLLGSLTVPSTMIFSIRILGRCFCKSHYLGVFLCVVGGAMTVWADFDKEKGSTDVHSGIGDMLAVLAALIYGLGDVISEYCVKNVDRYELLGMFGLFGALFTGLAFPLIERQALTEIIRDRSGAEQWQIMGVFTWYIASVLLYYMTEAFFLVASDATLLNLSMQSSNLWAILFSFLVYQALPPLRFYPSLLLVVTGVYVYDSRSTANHDDSNQHESQHFPPSSRNHYSAISVTGPPIV